MLTEQQKKAVKLRCIDELSVQQTALVLGVHRCTIWRWSKKKEFYREWEKQVNAAIRQHQRENPAAAWDAELRRLQTDLDKASAAAKGRNTKTLDRAWKAYSAHLAKPIMLTIKHAKEKKARR